MTREYGYKTNGYKQPQKGSKTAFGKTVRPVGYEREVKGYIIVKTALYPKVPQSKDNWKLKHVWIWEQVHHKQLPKGWVVRFKDGNTRNFDPTNLEAISRGMLQLMNGTVHSLGIEITTAEEFDVIKAYCELNKKIREKEWSKPRRCKKCGCLYVPEVANYRGSHRVMNPQVCRDCLSKRKRNEREIQKTQR